MVGPHKPFCSEVRGRWAVRDAGREPPTLAGKQRFRRWIAVGSDRV